MDNIFRLQVKFGTPLTGIKPPAHPLGGRTDAGDLPKIDSSGYHGRLAGEVLGQHPAGRVDKDGAAVVNCPLAVVAGLVGGQDEDAVVVGPRPERDVPAFPPLGRAEAGGGVGTEDELGAFEGQGLGDIGEVLLKA